MPLLRLTGHEWQLLRAVAHHARHIDMGQQDSRELLTIDVAGLSVA